ncbi:hypothetical protein TWF694_002152 [Orbilia ellipsospora]|uniref:Uncharacterized protein n=1 Tax=Orbilia ellipsospora TaxID=2528407 RepID=A0AAV9X5Z0_9PEZI
MASPHLRLLSHCYTSPCLLGAPKNSITQTCRIAQSPSTWPRSIIARRYYPNTPLERTGRSIRRLVLTNEDKAFIKSKFTRTIPRRLRSENDILQALRDHGYVPAIDRVEEMLDTTRSPLQSIDEFDKITLGLLMRMAKTVDGGIRNPYKIPNLNTGQNPVKMRNKKMAKPTQVNKWFLFPDDTNWTYISKHFPLLEPPRPWHPIIMHGLKQDYSKEEVARRLEWSMVQNAKRFRNGYHYPPPDAAKYEILTNLPLPPPPVIRTCNVCKKPRYLLRFWNFYYQRWQHVNSPHRPGDCDGHKRGTSGRLMYAPPGTKIGNQKASQVEDKEWIDEETAVKILFRSNFIILPTVNPEIGKIFAKASMCSPETWPWTRAGEGERWALRGGRMNGLVDLSDVKKLSKLEEAREKQTEAFMTEHKALLNKIAELLQTHPITAEEAAALPSGQLYPAGHPAVALWSRWEQKLYKTKLAETAETTRKRQTLRQTLDNKVVEYDAVLDELKRTEAELLMLESGQGESWVDPAFIKLKPWERRELLEKEGDINEEDTHWDSSERPPRENVTPLFSKISQDEYLLRFKLERGWALTETQKEHLERRLHHLRMIQAGEEKPLETEPKSLFSKWDNSDAIIDRLKELRIARNESIEDLVLLKLDPQPATSGAQETLITKSAETEARDLEKNDSS